MFIRFFTKMPFYAVAKGRNPGIYLTWPECQEQVTNFNKPVFKKFSTENEAQEFINTRQNKIVDRRTQNGSEKVTEFAEASTSNRSTEKMVKDRSLSPTVVRMGQQMKKLQAELSKLRDEFDEYVKKDKSSEEKTPKVKRKKENPLNTTNKKIKLDKNITTDKSTFNTNSDGFIQIFTDGACSNNGYHNAKAGVGVYFGRDHPMNVSEPVVGRQTNNTAEIQAATYAVELAKAAGFDKIQINTDSNFMIQCMTEWMPKWKKNGWKKSDGKEILNLEDLQDLDGACNGVVIKWNHVKAHKGVPGNEEADELARKGALKS